jgi:parallel beta-helix repeat protein
MLSSGGGLFMDDSTATIRNNTFADNDATQGGGLWVSGSEGALSDNFIEDNRAARAAGGGIHIERSSSLLVVSNTIQGNSAMGTLGEGGGVDLSYANSTLVNNTIRDNRASNSGGGVSIQGGADLSDNVIEGNTVNWYGGGVYLIDSDAPSDTSTLTANVIRGNNAEGWGYPGRGGGVCLRLSDGVTLTRNLVQNNEAHQGSSGLGDGAGGGIYMEHGDAMLINNIVTDNWAENVGSGLEIKGSDPLLYHTTIANNTGGDGSGVRVVKGGSDKPSQPELYNTIIANQTTGVYASGDVLNVVTMDGVLWWGNTNNTAGGGTFFISNDIPGDPAFVNAAGYD